MLTQQNDYLNLHTNQNQFLSAIEYTSAATGFRPELIEKDYYCTLALQYLYHHHHNLVFKGGTLLAKVHAGFYRLSEDLDFTLPTSPQATRTQRSNSIKFIKETFIDIQDKLPIFTLDTPLTGSNNSLQYNGILTYPSLLSKNKSRILLEIGLRENLIIPAMELNANTMLLNPFTGDNLAPLIKTRCLTKEEAYAEKIRAALTRNRLAIRDFYDIDHAIKNSLIDLGNMDFLTLICQKIHMNDNFVVFDDIARKNLEQKLHTELAPTLKNGLLTDFDLNAVIRTIENTMSRISQFNLCRHTI
jgi:predicted nucleotidyltransferase component of viral defense system